MISKSQSQSIFITQSQIIYKSNSYHPFARFVTAETVALMFDLYPHQIYRIECWRYTVYVHAQGVSRFVSYADFPPILGVQAPNSSDFRRWRRRWYKRWRYQLAPEFWTKFFAYQFQQAASTAKRSDWGELVGQVKSLMSETELYKLRKLFSPEKYWLANF